MFIRLQILTEFDVFVKSFVYLVHRLPRSLVLEPFDVDATIEPIEFTKCQLLTFAAAKMKRMTDSVDYDVQSAMADTTGASTGRYPAEEVHASIDAPLTEAETDVFPCVLAVLGSAFALMKVISGLV